MIQAVMHFDLNNKTLCGKPNNVRYSVPAESPLSFVKDHFAAWHREPCPECVARLPRRDWYAEWRASQKRRTDGS